MQANVLSTKELNDAWRKFKSIGDITARNQIIESNIPLLKHLMSTRFDHYSVSTGDIESTAYMVLVTAVDKFDPDRGNSFYAYLVSALHKSLAGVVKDDIRYRKAVAEYATNNEINPQHAGFDWDKIDNHAHVQKILDVLATKVKCREAMKNMFISWFILEEPLSIIAEDHGITKQGVSNNIKRVVRLLREQCYLDGQFVLDDEII